MSHFYFCLLAISVGVWNNPWSDYWRKITCGLSSFLNKLFFLTQQIHVLEPISAPVWPTLLIPRYFISIDIHENPWCCCVEPWILTNLKVLSFTYIFQAFLFCLTFVFFFCLFLPLTFPLKKGLFPYLWSMHDSEPVSFWSLPSPFPFLTQSFFHLWPFFLVFLWVRLILNSQSFYLSLSVLES